MKSKYLIRILYGLIGTFVLFSIAAVLVVQFVNWNAYRSTIATMATEQLGLSVDLAGDVGVSLIPTPSFQVADVTVRPLQSGGEPVAKASLIAVRLSVSDLLRGRLGIASLELVGAEVALEEVEGGSIRVTGWSRAADPDQTSTNPSGGFSLGRLDLENGRVSLRRLTGETHILDAVDASLSGSLPIGPLTFEAAATIAGQKVRTDGRMRPVGDDGFALLVDATAGGASWRLSGRTGAVIPFVGRFEASGPDIGRAVNALSLMAGSAARMDGPALPFALDIQTSEDRGLMEVVGRQVRLGDSVGTLDATVAFEDIPHITGRLSVSVLDLAEFRSVSFEPGGGEGDQDTGEPLRLPLRGSLDLAVESVKMERAVIQQVTAALQAQPERVTLANLQALMPGGSNATLSGVVTLAPVPRFDGRLKASSGNLRDLLQSVGYPVPQTVPTGRLTAADMTGRLQASAETVRFDIETGAIDTITLGGFVAAQLSPGQMLQADLQVGNANLDAYLPVWPLSDEAGPMDLRVDTALADITSAMADWPVMLTLRAGDLMWRGRTFTTTRVGARLSGSGIQDIRLETRLDGARLDGRGQVLASADRAAWRSDMTLGLSAFDPTIVTSALPVIAPYLQAFGNGLADTTLRLSGALDETIIAAQVTRGTDTLTMNGTADLSGSIPRRFDLQARLTIRDITPVLRAHALDPVGLVPVDLTAGLSRADSAAPYRVRLTGTLKGGDLAVDGQFQAIDLWQGNASFSHTRAAVPLSVFALEDSVPGSDGPLSVRLGARQSADVLSLEAINAGLGRSRLDGDLVLARSGRVTGSLSLADITFDVFAVGPDEPNGPQAVPGVENESDPDSLIAPLDADVAVALSNVGVLGQTITAPSGRITASGGEVTVRTGEAARLGDGPLWTEVRYRADGSQAWHVSLQADRIDTAGALGAAALSRAVSGTARVTLELSGKGFDGRAARSSLSGEASLDQSGGALHFLNVPGLIQSARQAGGVRGFLEGIAGTLRKGTSPTDALRASARIADGVALIDRFEANGSWGRLTLDGQVNMADYLMNISGALQPSSPEGAPPIDVRFNGNMLNPQSAFASSLFEQFVFGRIERRQRDQALAEQREAGPVKASPGQAIFGILRGAIEKLKDEKAETDKPEDDADKPD